VEEWIANSETPTILVVSAVTVIERELLRQTLENQDRIEKTLRVSRNLGKHWEGTVAAHCRIGNQSTSNLKDTGSTWARESTSLLGEFLHRDVEGSQQAIMEFRDSTAM